MSEHATIPERVRSWLSKFGPRWGEQGGVDPHLSSRARLPTIPHPAQPGERRRRISRTRGLAYHVHFVKGWLTKRQLAARKRSLLRRDDARFARGGDMSSTRPCGRLRRGVGSGFVMTESPWTANERVPHFMRFRVEGSEAGAGFDGFGDVDDVRAGRVEGDGERVARLEDFEFTFAVQRDRAGRSVERRPMFRARSGLNRRSGWFSSNREPSA